MSTTASDDALRQIMAMIFDGGISPGSRLPSERELCVKLGVSRTVRDAINQLTELNAIDRPKSHEFGYDSGINDNAKGYQL